MKPKNSKVSTGYLTPQAKKTKPTAKRNNNLSDREEENETPEINSQLVEALLQNPEKKKMILQLLSLNKDVIEKHTSGSSLPSSVDKLKTKKICESPTDLMRRRALEKMNGSPSTSKNNFRLSKTNSSSSSCSTTLDKVLEGVKAYVEIRDRNNEDKSRGAKEILKSMGATVVDKLTREVTHVVFKDGSYKTFQMAKLLKVHIVSILWVEFSRKSLQRANEKRFPAMGTEYEDETIVCSQMHKEYEDIIRDEYRKSILQGTPLPSTRALINRRRTLMTPSVTSNAPSNSDSSYNTAIASEAEIAPIVDSADTETLIMNDPEGLSLVDNESRASDNSVELNNVIEATPKRPYNNNLSSFDRRKTIGHSLCSDASNFKAPQLRVSLEKLQLTKQNADPVKSSSNDSEINLPSNRIQRRKSMRSRDAQRRKTLSFAQTLNQQPAETKRRRSLAPNKLQVNLDRYEWKTKRQASSDSMNLTLDPSQTLLRTEEIFHSDSSDESLEPVRSRKVLRIAPRKHVTGDSDNTDVEKSVTRVIELTSDSSDEILKGAGSKKLAKSKNHVDGDSDNTDVDKSVAAAELTSDSSAESLKTLGSKKVTRTRTSKDHVSDSDNTDIDKSPTRSDLLTSDSSDNSLKSAFELQKSTDRNNTRPLKRIPTENHLNSSGSDKSAEAATLVKAKPASKSQKLTKKHKIKHVTGDPVDSRKLYDPNTSIHLVDIDDEKERQEKREQNKKRKLEQAGFVNPVTALFEKIAQNAAESQQSEASPPKSTKKPPKEPSDNGSEDEQRQLLEEVLKRPKNLETRRKSLRICNSQSAKKATASKTEPTKRRSTMAFMSKTQMSSKKKIDKGKLPTIVCTKLHRSEVQVFTQIVRKLGRFTVEDEVSDKTTHLVAGEAQRTLNMLRAIARGCWVLKHEWILRSLEAGKWLPEENFELHDYSPAVRKCRLERQAFGANYTMDVFESCPPIFVTLGTTPRCSDLRELIRTCKGKVVTNQRMAKIIVGQYVDEEHICVTEKWVLDCVNLYEKKDFKDYLIESGNRRKSFAV